MIERTLVYSQHKTIWVYDDVLDFQSRQSLFSYFSNSYFTTTGYDADFHTHRSRQLYSNFGPHDLARSRFCTYPGICEIYQRHSLESMTVKATRVNAVVASERNQTHSDACDYTMIYFSNMVWPLEWGGHLFFPTENMDDIKQVVAFRPGRVVFFDGSIPHLVQTITPMAEDMRFSFVLQFVKDDLSDKIVKQD